MKRCLVKCFWVLLVLLLECHLSSLGCLEEERIALLKFKASCNWTLHLPSWISEKGSNSSSSDRGDCCSWEGVQCNAATRRVIQLSLDHISSGYYYDTDDEINICYLNVTIFSTFRELQHLNLSYNLFDGWIKNEGFERLGVLRKLEVLDLAGNLFNESIFPSLAELKSLKTLSLHGNNLRGSHLEEILSNLHNLKSLDLGDNGLETSSRIMQGSASSVGLGRLEALQLVGNNFNNSILPFLGTLTSLRTLSLRGNRLEGSLYIEELSNLHNLKSLDLSNNQLNGSSRIMQGFEKLGMLRKLKVLDLSGNYFKESILPSLAELKSLKTLSLHGNNLGGSYLEEILSTFHNLKSLDLGSNSLETSSRIMQGSASSVGLGRLEALQLDGNNFNNSILPFLGTLTSLRTLSLWGNRLEGSLHIEELSNLHNLKSLDLSGNGLNGSSQTMQALGKLNHLQSLDLSYNDFVDCSSQATFQGLANLSDLESLQLTRNNMNCSSQAIQAFCGMKRLQELDLSGNNFEGNLPLCLQNLTSLTTLDLSFNQFRGNIPSSLITSLSSLSVINLRYNDFEGTFIFDSFANLSKLEVIDLTNAGDNLEIGTSDQHLPWAPLFQLKQLFLSNCNFSKQMSDAIPRFLSNQYNLESVDLSHCNLIGPFPSWLLENNTRLTHLYLQDNSLRRNFLLPSYVHTAATVIDVSNNCIDGLLQENIGNILPSVEYLNLSMNSFGGGIPASIGNMSRLDYLSLSDNKFRGEIPQHMALGCNQLSFIEMSNNRLHGQVFPPQFNFTSLTVLKLDNNSFSGNILSGLSNSKDLVMLDISYNKITGKIPGWIGNLTYLAALNMGGNLLQGNIPMEFQSLMSLELIDLSGNHLSGSMVSILNSTSLTYLHLQGNEFISSPSHYSIINNTMLITLDIRNNDLCGGIPNWMGVGLTNLRILLLQGNHFNGTIPNHLCQLNHIGLMDLSHNSLSGSIPRCLNNISFGRKPKIESKLTLGFNYWIQGNANSEEIEFTTKSLSWVYKGDILLYMSGLDLACNNLIGDIPHEIGTLNGLHALNLSHNQLSSSIPKTFSSLQQIESLDLSYNRLIGEIPSELAVLNNLEVFIVAHNNLSGKTPEMKGQFSTFECNSYEGNPSLCVQSSTASSSCTNCFDTYGESTNKSTTSSSAMDNDSGIDMSAFIASFVGSYVICLLGIATILYINPYWRRMWFHFIENFIYFLSSIYYKLHTCIW